MPQTHPFAFAVGLVIGAVAVAAAPAQTMSEEPIELGPEPQFVFDLHVVDNHWAIKYHGQAVTRVLHQPVKHADNPLFTDGKPSFFAVVRDEDDGAFRMWYQKNVQIRADDAKGRKYETAIGYAHSDDGIKWSIPALNLFERTHPPEVNNIVIGRPGDPTYEASAPSLVEISEDQRRGYRYLLQYRGKGSSSREDNAIRIVGSNDGIHWDIDNSVNIVRVHSDHHNTFCYDPVRDEYVLYCRAKDIYRHHGETMIDTGASRRVARMASKTLWTDWVADGARPQTILVPDELDNQYRFNFFYGMPTRYYAGVYWGFLQPFRLNDYIYTELVVSRDGMNFTRLPQRQKLIEYGPEGSWDDTMIFTSPYWVTVGDEWWVYYSGWDGAHGTTERGGGIGLATIRREGFISMRGPAGGGVVCTRRIVWPGGDLIVNADAASLSGEMKVRVADAGRKPIEGFNYEDQQPFTGDAVNHVVQWNGKRLDELKGQVIRLEFFLRDADLYTFRAGRDR